MEIKINTLSPIIVFIPFLEGLTASLGDIIVLSEKLSNCEAYLFLSDHKFYFF